MNSLSTIEESPSSIEQNVFSNVTVENLNSENTSSSNINGANIRITIALAVPAEIQALGDTPLTQGSTLSVQRVPGKSKVHGYYRIEYSLLPGEPNVGFDLVIFRTAAKVYPDNEEARITLTWEDNNSNVWIVLTQIHTIELTRERLSDLLSHTILVKIWDGREYCTTRTKLDKPRINRSTLNLLSNIDEANLPKTIVQNMAQNYADKWVAKPMLYKLHRRLPINIPVPSPELQRKIDETESVHMTPGRLSRILQEKPNSSIIDGSSRVLDGSISNSTYNPYPGILKKTPDEDETTSTGNVKRKKVGSRLSKQSDEKREKGSAQVIVPSKLIFAGFKMITCRLGDELLLPKAIQDCFVSLNIEDHQLLNETFAKEFNPLTITICHIENMPSTPISYPELRQRCQPVYCSYRLFNQPVHCTERKMQARHIYWNDLNLCLMNLIDDTTMSLFRNSPIVNIEVHDRDELESSRLRTGSVFGTENTDETIGRVSGKMNLLKSKPETNWNPHGCVQLDLSEIWLGQTSFEFYIPVVPCHAPELHIARGTSTKRSSTGQNTFIQQGDFLSSGTQMKILVKLAKPLTPLVGRRLFDDKQLVSTLVSPFTRIVFLFPSNNAKFLTALETCIRTINAKALDFDTHPAHIQVAALSTYKLTETQQTSPTLNIITGFHLFDDEQHLFVLEGRQEDAIDVIYKQLPKPQKQNVEILYDSAIRFSERLYVKFGVDLMHIKLSRTLRGIISEPLIFVRDILPKETFEALDKLYQLITSRKLSSSARYNLFPTTDMITSLSRDFAVPLTEKEIKLFSSDDRAPSASTVHEKKVADIVTNYNTNITSSHDYKSSTNETKRPDVNFIEQNIERIRFASLKNSQKHSDKENIVFMTTGPVYPYSSQKLNATENALEQLRTHIKRNYRSSSCSFNPEYRSATFSPYSNDGTVFDYHNTLRSPLDMASTNDKPTEKVSDWIIHRGHRTSRQSNTHPKSPDPARLEELSRPPDQWYDKNYYNRQATATERESFKWINRKEDFDRWTQTSPTSHTISALWQSPNEVDKTSNSLAKPGFLGDERMHFLRRSAKTEMSTNGRYSATQLDRLNGILKDKPVKKGLLLPKSYERSDGAHSAPLMHRRSLTNTPSRRIRSTTTMALRKHQD